MVSKASTICGNVIRIYNYLKDNREQSYNKTDFVEKLLISKYDVETYLNLLIQLNLIYKIKVSPTKNRSSTWYYKIR